MNRMTLLDSVLALAAVLAAGSHTAAQDAEHGFQVNSAIGSWVGPWDDMPGRPVAMTPDGSWIAFVELDPGFIPTCDKWNERISMSRPDGTGYRVVLDAQAIEDLSPSPPWLSTGTLIKRLAISGDARTIAFTWPHMLTKTCSEVLPFHSYLVDVETRETVEIETGMEFGTQLVTFSDDGERIAYVGWDLNGMHCFVAERSSPTHYDHVREFVSPGVLGKAFLGTLTGDGRKFAFIAAASIFFPAMSDVYLLCFADGSLTKVNRQTLSDIVGLSVSRDGSRVVYGVDYGPVYAVNGDGSEHRVLVPVGREGQLSVTRDGEWVFFADLHADYPSLSPVSYRIRWDGSGRQLLAPMGLPKTLGWFPVSGDGSVYAYWLRVLWLSDWPLHVGFLDKRAVLTAYGSGLLGEPVGIDVGGPVGSSYVLAASLGAAEIATPHGTLLLDPASLLRLSSGTILPGDPGMAPGYVPLGNTATHVFAIPNDVSLKGLDVHLQALVMEPTTGMGSFTNSPLVQFH